MLLGAARAMHGCAIRWSQYHWPQHRAPVHRSHDSDVANLMMPPRLEGVPAALRNTATLDAPHMRMTAAVPRAGGGDDTTRSTCTTTYSSGTCRAVLRTKCPSMEHRLQHHLLQSSCTAGASRMAQRLQYQLQVFAYKLLRRQWQFNGFVINGKAHAPSSGEHRGSSASVAVSQSSPTSSPASVSVVMVSPTQRRPRRQQQLGRLTFLSIIAVPSYIQRQLCSSHDIGIATADSASQFIGRVPSIQRRTLLAMPHRASVALYW